MLIYTLLIVMLAHILDFVIMMPLGPLLMAEFNLSAASFGILVSCYTLAAAISSLVSTLWVDRVNRRTAMLLLIAGFTVGNLICCLAGHYSVLLLGRITAGMFGGVMTAVVYSLVGQVVPLEQRGRASGLLGIAFPLVSIVGVPFGLWLAEHFGWRTSFYLVLGVSLVALLFCAFILPSIKPETEGEWDPGWRGAVRTLVKVWQRPPHRLGIIIMITVVMGGFTIIPYIAPFLIGNGYIPSHQLYLIYLVGGVCSIISSRILGYISDRKGKIATLKWVLLGSILALALFTNLPKVGLTLVLVSTSFLMVCLPGRFVCLMAWFTIISHPKQRGVFMSLLSTIQQLAIGIAALTGGLIIVEADDGGLSRYWLAGLVAATANFAILLLTTKMAKMENLGVAKQLYLEEL